MPFFRRKKKLRQPGLPTSLMEAVVKEVVYALKQFRRRAQAYPQDVQVRIPARWLPLHPGAALDVPAFKRAVRRACVAVCDDDLKPWLERELRLDVEFAVSLESVAVEVVRFKPEQASRLPFPLP